MKMIIFLLLTSLVAAQNCPYCRSDACEEVVPSIYSCKACNIGTIVPVAIVPTDQHGPVSLQICQLCPDHCYECNFTVYTPFKGPPFPAVNCTSCASRYINNQFNGKCQACPPNCLECYCKATLYYPCNSTLCKVCDAGYTLNEG